MAQKGPSSNPNSVSESCVSSTKELHLSGLTRRSYTHTRTHTHPGSEVEGGAGPSRLTSCLSYVCFAARTGESVTLQQCVCVCVQVHVCMCVHACLYVCMCVGMCMHGNVCLCVSLCAHKGVYMCTCVCTCVYVYTCACVCTFVCTCVHVLVCVHTCLCMCVHVCADMLVHVRVYVCVSVPLTQLCSHYSLFSCTCLAFFAAELGGSGLGGGWAVGEGLFMPVIQPGYTFLWLCL